MLRYLVSADCPDCGGKRLRREALSVTFAGLDIADLSRLSLDRLAQLLEPYARSGDGAAAADGHPEKAVVIMRIAGEAMARLSVLQELGLGYLSLDRSTPTLSPGELQRLRLGTQVHSNLFGVVYVLDEPSAGLHPADTQALLAALDRLRRRGIRCLSSNTTSTSCGMPTGSWTSVPTQANWEGRSSTAGRPTVSREFAHRIPRGTCSGTP